MRLRPASPALPPALALLKPHRFPGQLSVHEGRLSSPLTSSTASPSGPGPAAPLPSLPSLLIFPPRRCPAADPAVGSPFSGCAAPFSPHDMRAPCAQLLRKAMPAWNTDGSEGTPCRGLGAAGGGRPLRPGSPQHYERADRELQAERLQPPGSRGQSCDEEGCSASTGKKKIRRRKKRPRTFSRIPPVAPGGSRPPTPGAAPRPVPPRPLRAPLTSAPSGGASGPGRGRDRSRTRAGSPSRRPGQRRPRPARPQPPLGGAEPPHLGRIAVSSVLGCRPAGPDGRWGCAERGRDAESRCGERATGVIEALRLEKTSKIL